MPPSSGKPPKPVDKSRSSGSKPDRHDQSESASRSANNRSKDDRSEGQSRHSNRSKNEGDRKDSKHDDKRKSKEDHSKRDNARNEKDIRSIETAEEKHERKKREKSEKPELGEGDVAIQKESKDKRRKPDETAEERAERKAREKRERDRPQTNNKDEQGDRKQRETSEERRERKKKERGETGTGHRETSEERRERKRRERNENGGNRETSEERRSRKRREKESDGGHRETSAERRERKRREKAESGKRETSEERRERKRREKSGTADARETSAERRERKNRERNNEEKIETRKEKESSKRGEETPDERHERKKRERAERKAREEESEKRSETVLENKEDNEKPKRRDETAEERAERKKREKLLREEERMKEAEKVRKEKEAMKIEANKNDDHDENGVDDYNGYEDDDFEEYIYDEDFDEDESKDAINENDEDEVMESDDGKYEIPAKTIQSETSNQKAKPVKDFYSKLEVVSYTFDSSKSKKLWLLEKMKKRSLALLNRIELDHFSTDLFMLNPLSEYDMFMRKFGYSDTTQAVTQTREDDIEVGVQTEPADLKESWSQHPPSNTLKVSGTFALGGESETETSATGVNKLLPVSDTGSSSTNIGVVEDTRKLNRFLMKSSSVMSSLLGSRETIGQSGKAKSYFEIADTFSNLIISQNPLLANCQVVSMSCNDFKVIICLKLTSESFGEKGLVCVYSNVSFKEPCNYLVCSSELSSCALTSNPNNPVVFGGGLDGTLYMWDLNISAEHVTKTVEKAGRSFTLSFETFSTALASRLPSAGNTHKSPIVQLVCLENEPAGTGAMSKFQIASLDDTALLLFWSFHASDNENELTLLPGGVTKFSFSHSFDFIQCLSQNPIYKSSHRVGRKTFFFNNYSNQTKSFGNGKTMLFYNFSF